MNTIEENATEEIRARVRDRYARTAREGADAGTAVQTAQAAGYDREQLAAVPDGANLGLGCGNPTAIDTLKPGEVVVDLGSGGGMDVFIASRKVGPTGRVYGFDMTGDMITLARANAAKGGYTNVEFRLALIESLPLEDSTADAMISNCVINLSPEKARTFREAHRVLKPGGRLMVSDLVVDKPFPPEFAPIVAEYMECGSRASMYSDYLQLIRDAGFRKVSVLKNVPLSASLELTHPSVQEAMQKYHLSPETVRAGLENIRSVSVIAWK
ncbi:MAG: arsenite methyltransferase [Candidatus Coatesbacteria bacterium]